MSTVLDAQPTTRQQAAEQHPLWPAFVQWDAERNCAPPHMDNDFDRLQFEAFMRGHEVGGQAVESAALQLLRDIYEEHGRHFHIDRALADRVRNLIHPES